MISVKKSKELYENSPSRMPIEMARDTLRQLIHQAENIPCVLNKSEEMKEVTRDMEARRLMLEDKLKKLREEEKTDEPVSVSSDGHYFPVDPNRPKAYLRVKYSITVECSCGKTFPAAIRTYPYPSPEVGFNHRVLTITDRSTDAQQLCPGCKNWVNIMNN